MFIIYKPEGVEISELVLTSASKKYSFCTGIFFEDGKWTRIHTTDPKYLTDFQKGKNSISVIQFSHTNAQDTLAFFKEWNDDWLYCCMEGTLVQTLAVATTFKDVKKYLNVLSYNGCLKFLDFLNLRNSHGLIFIKNGQLVVPNINSWEKKDGMFLHGNWTVPAPVNYNDNYNRTALNKPITPQADYPESVEVHGIHFSVIKPGMGLFFHTKGQLYISRIGSHMAEIAEMKVSEMDIIEDINGVENPNMAQLIAMLKNNAMEWNLKILRCTDLDPDKRATLHRIL